MPEASGRLPVGEKKPACAGFGTPRACPHARTGARGQARPIYGAGGNTWTMRFQLNGPKLLALARPSLSPGLTMSLTHSIGATLPCTTMRWKFFTS